MQAATIDTQDTSDPGSPFEAALEVLAPEVVVPEVVGTGDGAGDRTLVRSDRSVTLMVIVDPFAHRGVAPPDSALSPGHAVRSVPTGAAIPGSLLGVECTDRHVADAGRARLRYRDLSSAPSAPAVHDLGYA